MQLASKMKIFPLILVVIVLVGIVVAHDSLWAATFDSNIVPSTNNVYRLGVAAQDWKSINNTIFFASGNVGIGVASPGQTLEINGGVRLNTATTRPTCTSSLRGTLWQVQSAAGVKDQLNVCVKTGGDVYTWAPIY